jgi:hypothetical protein
MKYWPALMGFVVIVVLASACGGAQHTVTASATPTVAASAPSPSPQTSVVSSGKWWRRMGVTNCAYAAIVRVAGRVMGAGDCAGLFIIPPEKVTVRVGEEINVHMFEIGTLFTLPRSSASAVLQRIAVSPDEGTGTYRAVHAGHATLISRAWCVGQNIRGEITGSCPVLDVTVIPPKDREPLPQCSGKETGHLQSVSIAGSARFERAPTA